MSYNLTTPGISDLSFEDHNKWILHGISVQRNRERALNAGPAGSFRYNGHDWTPEEYQGFAIISMVNENKGNKSLTSRLAGLQAELLHKFSDHTSFFSLPVESFHQTIANTLSGDRFKKNILTTGLEASYPSLVAAAFKNSSVAATADPIRMKMTGLGILGTAIVMMGVFENESDYRRIVDFRSAFYADEELAKLDVRMTRPFIGHITLAYIEQDLLKNQKVHLGEVVNEINEGLSAEENYFSISLTGLRRYHHLAEFSKQDHYPVHPL